MNDNFRSTKSRVRNTLTVSAIAIALAGGYALRGTVVGAQQGSGLELTSAPVVDNADTRDAASMGHAFRDVAKAVAPAVVTITTQEKMPTPPRNRGLQGFPFGDNGGNGANGGQDPFEEFFKQFRNFGGQPNSLQPNSLQKEQMRALYHQIQESRSGLGSGMIYRSDGYILTNAHVVRGADTVTVKLNDEREFKHAKVVGIDDRTDVAVVKIDATDLPTVKLGDSSTVEVGDWAIAIGNPFGLEHTVTVGVISAKAREVPLNERSPGDYLQTDASINPGNSGGPLVDIYGRVIGINNAIYSQSGGNIGIGFAVPINTARDIAEQLVKSGKIRRGYLGVQITNVQDRAAALGLDPNMKGVLVDKVETGTPGEKAGLQPGDVITAFNGVAVTHSAELQRLVGAAPVGSAATLAVLRNGANITLTAHLDELKDDGTAPAASTPDTPDQPGPAPDALGLSLRALTPDNAAQLGTKVTSGLFVADVQDGSVAATAGIQHGDIIERVGQAPVSTVPEMQGAVKKILGEQTGDEQDVALYIHGKGYVVLKITK